MHTRAMSSYENYDPFFPDQPVVDAYLPIWAKLPAFRSKPTFIWADDSPHATTFSYLTYSQLNSSVQRIASRLLFPLRRADAVLILCPPGLGLVKAIFACQRAGLVAVPVIPPDAHKVSPLNQTPAHYHLLRALTQANPKAVIASSNYISTITRTVPTSTTDRLGQLLLKICWLSIEELDDEQHKFSCPLMSEGNAEYCGCQPDETYLLQYTSGATGIPKPVIVTAGAAAHNVREARKAYDLHPSSVIVSWLPQYHDCGLMFLLLTVVTGATCVLTSPAAFLNRPRLWLELVTEFNATCTPVPSFALPLVSKRGRVLDGKLPLKLGSVRNLVLINEPLYGSLVDEFVKEFECVGLSSSCISPSYGLAENCTFVSTAWQCNNSANSNPPWYKKLLPSARLASPDFLSGEIEIVVVDRNTCEPVEDGVEGEIWVSSPSNASGYLGHPSMTREAFHGRLHGRAGPCYVRTGDCGVVRAGDERYLYVTGRISDALEIHGRSVHAHYLETAAYNSSPMLLRGGCIAAFQMEEAVVIVAELQKNGARAEGVRIFSKKKICEGIREGVMKEEGTQVGMVVLVESGSIPKTTSGKLRRWAAKDKLLQHKFPVSYEVRFDAEMLKKKQGEATEGVGIGKGCGSDVAAVFASAAAGRRPETLRSFL